MFFDQQNDRIRTYLQRRHFSGEEIERFLAPGLWMRIIRETYLNFTQLLQSLTHLSLTQGYTGLAEQMKCFHGDKLAQIQVYSPRYSVFLLRTYAYLRDASAKWFNDVALFQPLLCDLYQRSLPSLSNLVLANSGNGGSGGNGGGGGGGTGSGGNGGSGNGSGRGCAWCYSADLHLKLGADAGQDKCPLKRDLIRTKACKAAREILAALKENPQAEKKELVQKVIANQA